MKSVPTIAFDHRPSRGVAAALLVIAVLAMLAPWATAWSWPVCTAISLVVIVYAGLGVRRFLRADVRRVAYTAAGWSLVDAHDREQSALLLHHSRVGALIALNFRADHERRVRVLLAPDNLDADMRRRLILLLARADVIAPQSPSR